MQIVNKETAVKFRQKDIVMIQILSEMKTLFQGMEMLTKKKTWILVNISHKKNNYLNPNPANSSQSENPAASIYTVAVLKGLELIQKTCFHLWIFFLRYFVNELAVI